MKLTALQIKKIDKSLQKQGLFYEDVRNEMIDHIATELERDSIESDNFEDALKQYMNSHRIVKLLTAAKRQQQIKDGYYHNAFLKQFVTHNGIVVLSFILFSIWALNKISWISELFLTAFLLVVVFGMFGINGMKSPRHAFVKRLYGSVKIYYLIAVVVLALTEYFYTGSEIFDYTKIMVLGVVFTGYWFMYRLNNNFKNNSYA